MSDDLPVLLTTKEAAVLLHLTPAGVRARDDLAPVGRTGHGEYLFPLAAVMQAPKNLGLVRRADVG